MLAATSVCPIKLHVLYMYACVKQHSHYALLLQEEDPLNSDDDVSDDDPADLFDTDNVVVCQFDKVHDSI